MIDLMMRKKLELYEKFENDLIIDDSEKQKAEIKKLESEKSELTILKKDHEKIMAYIARQENKK